MRLSIVDGLDAVGKDTHGRYIAEYYKKRENRLSFGLIPLQIIILEKKQNNHSFKQGKLLK